MNLRVALTLKSSNRKTGPIPVSTTAAGSCPPSCPLSAGGCYAKGGPLAIHWRNVTAGKAGMPWRDFILAIARLPIGQLWRHNQAGDLPGEGDAIDAHALGALVLANRGKRGFTYTHKPLVPANVKAIRKANAGGFYPLTCQPTTLSKRTHSRRRRWARLWYSFPPIN